MSVTINGTSGLVFNDASTQNTAAKVGMVNRIINGDMQIDQRNAGASVSFNAGNFPVDRFRLSTNGGSATGTVQQNLNVLTPPTGFTNYMGVSVTSGAAATGDQSYRITQRIEGFNVADLGFGASGASPVTVSFWVRSSITGTYGGSLQNSAGDRFYVFSYTINNANTWEYKTATIPGDTTGTWLKTNGMGIMLLFSIGTGSTLQGAAGSWGSTPADTVTGQTNLIGTSGATFYITGVQLEKGSTATSFDYRPYGTELALCQRYYVELYGRTNPYQPLGLGNTWSTTQGSYCIYLPVPMRAIPSLTTSGAIYFQNLGNINISSFAGPYTQHGTIVEGDFTMSSTVTIDRASFMRFNNVNTSTSRFNYSAEL